MYGDDDYILRAVKQAAAAIARIIGLRKAGDHERALQEVEQAWEELLGGTPPGLFDSMTATALAGFLGSPDKVRAVADLLEEEAAVHGGLGQTELAERRAALARELRALI